MISEGIHVFLLDFNESHCSADFLPVLSTEKLVSSFLTLLFVTPLHTLKSGIGRSLTFLTNSFILCKVLRMCEKAHLPETVHTVVLEVSLLLYINIYHRHSQKKRKFSTINSLSFLPWPKIMNRISRIHAWYLCVTGIYLANIIVYYILYIM